MLGIFQKVERFRSSVIEKTKQIKNDKEVVEEDEEENEIDDIDAELDDELDELEEVLVAIADLFASIFKSHKNYSICLVKKLNSEVLSKYFNNQNSSVFETKMGLFIVNDLIEHFGEEYLELNIKGLWESLVKVIFSYINNDNEELRECALHGIGFIGLNCIDFGLYNKTLLDGVKNSISTFPFNYSEEWYQAYNEIIFTCCRVIDKYNDPLWVELFISLGNLRNCDDEEEKEKVLKLCDKLSIKTK